MNSKLNNRLFRKFKFRNSLNLFCNGLIQKNIHKLVFTLLLVGFVFSSIAQSGLSPVDSLPERNPYEYSEAFIYYKRHDMITPFHISDLTRKKTGQKNIKQAIVYNDSNQYDLNRNTLIFEYNSEGWLKRIKGVAGMGDTATPCQSVFSFIFKKGIDVDTVIMKNRQFECQAEMSSTIQFLFSSETGYLQKKVILESRSDIWQNDSFLYDSFGRLNIILRTYKNGFKEPVFKTRNIYELVKDTLIIKEFDEIREEKEEKSYNRLRELSGKQYSSLGACPYLYYFIYTKPKVYYYKEKEKLLWVYSPVG